VKTLRSQKLRMLLTHRKLLQSKAIAIDNDLRGTLRNFGLKVGMVGEVSGKPGQRSGFDQSSAEREQGSDSGRNRDHVRNGIAATRKSLGFVSVSTF